MKLVRSDSAEVTRSIVSTAALACWGWSAMTLVCIAGVLGLLFTFVVRLIVPMRAAAWLGAPIFLALIVFLLWRGRSRRLNWVLAGFADRVYVRMSVGHMLSHGDVNEPDAIMIEASEIASMAAQTIKVFLYGPKPKIIERLVIDFARAVPEDLFSQIRPLFMTEGRQVLVTVEERRLTMKWKWCRPALRVFLQKAKLKCPSVVIAAEELSELDLNGIWNGFMEEPDAKQRQLLVQAKRLGFGWKCAQLLSLYRSIPIGQTGAYLEEIEREETGAQDPSGCSTCRF